MSRRTADANKAIRLAWEKERELVQQGKGTRDWTEKQQQEILNPEIGKAHDDKGRAFEGQHMKSVAEYPEHQGNPDNIQFLTKEEHLEAHKGSWQNPTNWYYNPVTKEYTDFGDGEIIPCEIINLSQSVVTIPPPNDESVASEKGQGSVENELFEEDDSTLKESQDSSAIENNQDGPQNNTAKMHPRLERELPKRENGFLRGLKTVGRFIVDHPVESLEIAGTVIVGTAEIISSFSRSRSRNTTSYYFRENEKPATPDRAEIAERIADIVEKATRSSPSENDVTAHRQRYHTKDGVIWKDKAPYHRGGKDT